jgi:hypothetical protein
MAHSTHAHASLIHHHRLVHLVSVIHWHCGYTGDSSTKKSGTNSKTKGLFTTPKKSTGLVMIVESSPTVISVITGSISITETVTTRVDVTTTIIAVITIVIVCILMIIPTGTADEIKYS